MLILFNAAEGEFIGSDQQWDKVLRDSSVVVDRCIFDGAPDFDTSRNISHEMNSHSNPRKFEHE